MGDNPVEQRVTANLDDEHRLAIAFSKYYVDHKTIEDYLKHLVRRGLLGKDTAYIVYKRVVTHYLKLGMDEFQKAVRTPVNYAAPFNVDINEDGYDVPELAVDVKARPPRGILDGVKESKIPNIFEDIEVDRGWIDRLGKATETVLRWDQEDKEQRGVRGQ